MRALLPSLGRTSIVDQLVPFRYGCQQFRACTGAVLPLSLDLGRTDHSYNLQLLLLSDAVLYPASHMASGAHMSSWFVTLGRDKRPRRVRLSPWRCALGSP